MILYWAVGWLAGVWLASRLSLPASFWAIIAALALLAAVMWRRQRAAGLLLLVLGAAACGGLRYDLGRPALDAPHIASRNNQGEMILRGWVARQPDLHDTSQTLLIQAESVAASKMPAQPAVGLVQLRAARFPVLSYGTRLQAVGTLEEPSVTEAFDYRTYLQRQGIYSVMAFPQITVLEGARGSLLLKGLTAVRQRAQVAIDQMLPNPQAALLSGTLLGDDHGLPQDLQEDFRNTGMTHIIAISGFNIAIIAGLLMQAGRLLGGRRFAAVFALVGVALYAVLVGAEASVVRAAIMGMLLIVAVQLLGRPTYAPATLGSAAFFMTLATPNILWDIGFQLSVAATLGLMTAVGPASQRLRQRLEPALDPSRASAVGRFISEIVLTTLAAFLFTLPVLLLHFGSVSIVSLPANFLLLPAQPWLMLWGGAATLLGMIHPLLGQAPAWVSWLFLTYTIEGVRFFGSLPRTMVPLPVTAVPLGALAVAMTVWFARRKPRPPEVESTRLISQKRLGPVIAATAMVAVLMLAALWRAPDGRLHVTFFDVGQGDAILIQTPRGRQMLVDGGAYPNILLSRLGDQLPFWDKQLDVVLATHPDTDHVAGLVDVLDHYDIRQLIGNSDSPAGSPGYDALLQSSAQHRVPLHVARTGEVIRLDQDVAIEILHAAESGAQSDNDNSIVLLLRYGELRVLLTGDSGEAAEAQMLRDNHALQAAVLKAGHHGARSSTGEALLAAVRPQYVVISAGLDNRYGHPHEETLQRIAGSGATVLRTDEMGSLELVSDGTRLSWR